MQGRVSRSGLIRWIGNGHASPDPEPDFSGPRGEPPGEIRAAPSFSDDGAPRWIVLASAGREERVGLAVATFERHLVVAAQDLRPAAAAVGLAHAPELLHAEGGARPVLSVPSLVRAITSR